MPSSPPSCHGPITTCARPRSLLLEVRLCLTLSCIQLLTIPLLHRHRHRPLTMRARPCRFRLSARPPMTVSCIQRLPTPLLCRHRHHPVTTCARRRSFRLSGRLLAPLLWGALHCHCPVTSHYSVHVVTWVRMFCTPLPTLFLRISSVASTSFGDRSPHYPVACHRLPPRLWETAPHTIPSQFVGWFRISGRS